MKSKIEKFLNFYNLTSENNTIIVGFSGGYDSMSLLDIIHKLSEKYKFNVVAAHLNHNWRGQESFIEAQKCDFFCNKYNITFYSETLDENEKHTETHARELRYDFFYKVINKFGADALLTAHTKSDVAETIIYRLTKGTGIKGLQGISPKLGKIYRPMLDISRNEIEEYCKINNLSPNIDSSNQDNRYSRNFIRNEILPLLKKINNNVESSLYSLANLAYEEEQIINEYIKSLEIFNNDKILTEKFKNLSYSLQKRLIYEFYVKYDIEYSQEKVENTLNFIIKNINSKSGKTCSIDSNHWIFVNNRFIYVIGKILKINDEINITQEGTYIIGNFEFEIKKCESKPKNFPLDKEYIAYVEITEGINFTLRTRKFGDIIQPLGSSSTTKLKKYFINKHIPKHEKDSIVLLCKDSEILWVSGYCISDKIKVVNNCTHVLSLKKVDGKNPVKRVTP